MRLRKMPYNLDIGSIIKSQVRAKKMSNPEIKRTIKKAI